jgi:hypothetical protein
MIALVYPGCQRTKFHTAEWTCWFFTSYFESHGLMKFRDGSDKGTASVHQSGIHQITFSDITSLSRVITGNESCIYSMTLKQSNNPPNGKVQTHCDWKRQDRWNIKGLFTKNLSWQAKQSIPCIAVTFYGACVKMCEDFVPYFENKRTGCCIMTTYTFISHHRIFFYQKHDYHPPPTLFSWLSPPVTFLCFPNQKAAILTNEVTEGKLGGAEHNFQDINKQTLWPLVCKRTIPTEWPLLLGQL